MRNVADRTLEALHTFGTEGLSGYSTTLITALELEPAPFGARWYGDGFRELAVNPYWLIQSLVSNAAKEGEGATQLWQIAGQIENPTIAEAVRLHAVDESRHARFYITVLELVFPDAADADALAAFYRTSPGYTTKEHPMRGATLEPNDIIDDLIQTNIGEIRTRIHQLLMRPVLDAYCPEENRARMWRLLDSLLRDETRHIQYTARIIDEAARRDPALILDTMRKRLAQFNALTLVEVGNQVFHST